MAKNTTPKLYKNTISVKGRAGKKVITGTGTIKDLAAAMKPRGQELTANDVPPAHGLVNGLLLTGHAVERKDLVGPKPKRGKTPTVYEFNLSK